MSNDPSPESIARAARLRAQIDKLTHSDIPASDPAEDEKQPMSPREFTERAKEKFDSKK